MERITPCKLAHVVLRTARYDAMKAWYQTVLQAEVVFADPMLAFLTYDDEHHRIAIANMPGLTDQSRGVAGVEHFAFTYRSLADLVHTYERLKAANVTPYWCINHGPTTSMYYRDPDRNQIELQVDNFQDPEELHAWFKSGAFAQNPLGVVYDPEQLAARVHAGVPERELVRQGAVP